MYPSEWLLPNFRTLLELKNHLQSVCVNKTKTAVGKNLLAFFFEKVLRFMRCKSLRSHKCGGVYV